MRMRGVKGGMVEGMGRIAHGVPEHYICFSDRRKSPAGTRPCHIAYPQTQ